MLCEEGQAETLHSTGLKSLKLSAQKAVGHWLCPFMSNLHLQFSSEGHSKSTEVDLRGPDTVFTQRLAWRLSLLWSFMPFSECPLGVG